MTAQHIPLSHDQLASAGSPARSRQDRYPDRGPLPGGHALLDLSSVKLLKIPDAAPPFDGEVLLTKPPWTPGTPELPMAAPPPPGAGSSAAEAGDGIAGGENGVAKGSRALGTAQSRAPGTAQSRVPDGFGAGHAADCDWARQFARLLVETLAGARPLRQLLPWISDRARVQMRRVAPVLRCGQRPRVVRVLASQPRHGVLEMAVIVTLGPRTRALALRLEAKRPEVVRLEGAERAVQPGRWLCTDIEAALRQATQGHARPTRQSCRSASQAEGEQAVRAGRPVRRTS